MNPRFCTPFLQQPALRGCGPGVSQEEGVKENQTTRPPVQNLIIHNRRWVRSRGAQRSRSENITVNSQEVDEPLPAEGPVAALDAGIAKVLELVKAPGSAGYQINSPFGQMTRGEFLMAPFMDLLIHSWDLSRGTGQGTNLDTGLVEVCYAAFSPQMDGMRNIDGGDGKHLFGSPITIADSAGVQDKLLGMLGRQP